MMIVDVLPGTLHIPTPRFRVLNQLKQIQTLESLTPEWKDPSTKDEGFVPAIRKTKKGLSWVPWKQLLNLGSEHLAAAAGFFAMRV